MKSFGQKNFKFHAGVKKCHFGNFSEWAGMACPVSPALNNPSQELLMGAGQYLERVEGETKGPFFKDSIW